MEDFDNMIGGLLILKKYADTRYNPIDTDNDKISVHVSTNVSSDDLAKLHQFNWYMDPSAGHWVWE